MNQNVWHHPFASPEMEIIALSDSPSPSPVFEPECLLTESEDNSPIDYSMKSRETVQSSQCFPPQYHYPGPNPAPPLPNIGFPQVFFNNGYGESFGEVAMNPVPESPPNSVAISEESSLLVFPIKTAEEFEKIDEMLGENEEERELLVSSVIN